MALTLTDLFPGLQRPVKPRGSKLRETTTKTGPGRRHVDGLQQPKRRAASRGQAGGYGKGLVNLWTAKQAAQLAEKRARKLERRS